MSGVAKRKPASDRRLRAVEPAEPVQTEAEREGQQTREVLGGLRDDIDEIAALVHTIENNLPFDLHDRFVPLLRSISQRAAQAGEHCVVLRWATIESEIASREDGAP